MSWPIKSSRILILLLLLWGCYEPHGDVITSLPPPNTSSIAINLADSIGTVYIYSKTELTFKINSPVQKLYSITGSLDGIPLPNTYNSSSITLDPKNLSNGSHTLKISVTFTIISQSLASKLGRETTVVSKEYPITIDLASPPPVKIQQFDVTNGSLVVRWNKPDKLNFTSYKIWRFAKNETGGWFDVTGGNPLTADRNALSFTDPYYIGESIQFRIDMVGYKYETQGVPTDTLIAAISPQWTPVSDLTVQISWPAPILYNGILNIQALGQVLGPVSHQETIPISFGDYTVQQFIAASKQFWPTHFQFLTPYLGQEVIYTGLGKTLQRGPVIFGPKEIVIDLQTDNSGGQPKLMVSTVKTSARSIEAQVDLTSYLATAINPNAKANVQVAYSQNGQYFIVFAGSRAHMFDNNIQFIKTVDLSSVLPQDYSIAYSITLSNNGLAAFRAYPGLVVLADMVSGTVLFQAAQSTNSLAVSVDGAYFVENGKIHNVSNSTVMPPLTTTLPNDNLISNLFFKENDSNQIVIDYGDHASVFDIQAGAITGNSPTLVVYRNGYLTYDPVSGHYGYPSVDYSSNPTKTYYNIFDIPSNTISRVIPVNGGIYFRNNTLVSSKGFRFPL